MYTHTHTHTHTYTYIYVYIYIYISCDGRKLTKVTNLQSLVTVHKDLLVILEA